MAALLVALPVITTDDAATATSPAPAMFSYTTHLTTKALRGHLFALSQYARRVSDVTQEDTVAPSPFHSVSEPPIDLAEYVIGAAIKCRLDKVTVLLSFAYVGAYSRALSRHPSILSAHRLCAAALYTAASASQPLRAVVPKAFSTALGLSVDELLDLSAFIRETTGASHPTNAQLDALFLGLEAARSKTLRGEIASAMSAAFGLSVPVPSPTPLRRRASSPAPPPLPIALGSAVSPSPFLQAPPVDWASSLTSGWGASTASAVASVSSPGSLGDSPCPHHLAGGSVGLVRLLREDPLQPQLLPSVAGSANSAGFYSLPTFESEFDEDVVLPPVVNHSPQPPPPVSAAGPFRRQHRQVMQILGRY